MPLQPRHGLPYPSRKETAQNYLATDGTNLFQWRRKESVDFISGSKGRVCRITLAIWHAQACYFF
jgi:hypothetical protein